ncbi:thiamine phosphate synthase [Loktanella agnita]
MGIYFVTDADAAAPIRDQVQAALAAGVRIIQLRDKQSRDAEMTALAHELLPLVHAAGGRLIINDRIGVAIACAADGLHVGQGDGNICDIRTRIGPDMILGLSVGTRDQLRDMPATGVDYIGVGPLRATPTKPDHDTPIGFNGLAQIVTAAPCPAIAIGGIGLQDIPEIHQTGCSGAAVVSAISRQADMQRAARDLVTAWRTQ